MVYLWASKPVLILAGKQDYMSGRWSEGKELTASDIVCRPQEIKPVGFEIQGETYTIGKTVKKRKDQPSPTEMAT